MLACCRLVMMVIRWIVVAAIIAIIIVAYKAQLKATAIRKHGMYKSQLKVTAIHHMYTHTNPS